MAATGTYGALDELEYRLRTRVQHPESAISDKMRHEADIAIALSLIELVGIARKLLEAK
jgi:hypothetical protein